MINFIYNIPTRLELPTIPINIGTAKAKNNSYISNPILDNVFTKNQIINIVNKNSRIKELLSKHNIQLEVNLNVLEEIKQKHLKH